MTTYGYEIKPRPADLGGGWRLRLLEDGAEAGGGVFPLAAYPDAENAEQAEKMAYEDALAEASAWMAAGRSSDDMLSPDEAIARAIKYAATAVGEYEFAYPSDDNPHRVVLRVVVYDCGLQAWYVPGAPYEWIPITGEEVLERLERARIAAAGHQPPLDDFDDIDVPF